MMNRVIVTSANTARYIAWLEDDEEAWYWTRAIHRAHRFENPVTAEQFVSRYLRDVDVWYLKHLW